MKASVPRVVLALSVFTLTLSAPSASQSQPPPSGDELIILHPGTLAPAALPSGPRREVVPLSDEVHRFVILPDGRLIGVVSVPGEPAISVPSLALVEIDAEGGVEPIGAIEPDERASFGEYPADLVVDGSGRLFLLSSMHVWWNPPEFLSRFIEVDPDDATTLSSIDLDDGWIGALATAPEGLWALGAKTLLRLDTDTGKSTDTGLRLPPTSGFAAAADSTGALWLISEGVCSPPCLWVHRFDPITGASRTATSVLAPGTPAHDLAVRQGCVATPTSACLQGGRFRAEVSWRDSSDRTGPGRVAPGRSADTALFWFFDPANWELMVKVLDGCELNGHFWVFGSASTSVEYTLVVTDLENGSEAIYGNPLGELARALADTNAFPCS